MTKKSNKYIELFAGCGGLSLGLEAAGYDLLFANELSPMAGETYAFNILNENLEEAAIKNEAPNKVYWISSQFKKNSLKQRLRENPYDAENGRYNELDQFANKNLTNKLFIGNINNLIAYLKGHKEYLSSLVSQDVDLISGGPPCQSFSLAGLRDKNNNRNTLPLSFARLVGMIKPKSVLLENVEGITAPFKDGEKKYYAWLEIAKAFALEGYFPICMLVNSKYFNIPQNRPRFILLAFRQDIIEKIDASKVSEETKEVIELSRTFNKTCQNSKDYIESVTIDDFKIFDIEKSTDRKYFNGDILPQFIDCEFVSVSDAIDNIKSIKEEFTLQEVNKGYINDLNTLFNHHPESYFENNILKNHLPRKHTKKVESRFRLYQLISKLENGNKKLITDALKGEVSNVSQILDILKTKKVFIDDKRKYLKSEKDVLEYFEKIKTKKQAQRALIATSPSPAQLTIPDDVCHYDKNQMRTLTVREMARIQTFPDWFEFKSKITTGGKMRKFEVPQYTQVGNAVPPLLAYNMGNLIKKILKGSNG